MRASFTCRKRRLRPASSSAIRTRSTAAICATTSSRPCRAAVEVGVAALRFNFRGVGSSEGSFGQGIAEQDDVAAALAYLRDLPEIDSQRIALAGYSFGAAVALRAAAGGLRGLIAISTPTVSGPLPQVEGVCPLLLISGDRDEYSDPKELARWAETIGPQARLVILPGVDHFWWGSADRLEEAVSNFLAKHLGGGRVEPADDKARP